MPFCLSLAVLDGEVTLKNFCRARLEDTRIQDIMKRVNLYLDPGMNHLGYRGTENANVTITTKYGKCWTKRVDIARGHFLNPVTDEELTEKFRECSSKALPEKESERILTLLLSLEELCDINELFAFRSFRD